MRMAMSVRCGSRSTLRSSVLSSRLILGNRALNSGTSGTMACSMKGEAALTRSSPAGCYSSLVAARILTGLAHGVFFSIGSTIATGLVPKDKAASAIAIMFTGLTVALVTGVPLGTFIGQHFGWRETFL